MINKLIIKKQKQLETKVELMKAYLDVKREEEEWHGVEDAASDIRDLLAALEALEDLKETIKAEGKV